MVDGRRRVDVRITPQDGITRTFVQPLLKDGTITDDTGFVSFVYPPDAKKFAKCLSWNENYRPVTVISKRGSVSTQTREPESNAHRGFTRSAAD